MKYTGDKILALLDMACWNGISTDPLLAQLGWSQERLSNPDQELSLPEILQIFEAVIAASSQGDLAFQAGRQVNITHLGMFGFAILSQGNMREVMKFALQYRALTSPLIGLETLETLETEDRCSFVFLPPVGIERSSPLFSHILDFNIAMFTSFIRDCMGDFSHIAAISIVSNDHPTARVIEHSLGIPVKLGQQIDGIELCHDALDRPLARSNALAADIAKRTCDELLNEDRAKWPFVEKVQSLIITNLGHSASAPQIAAMLYLSERSLRRHLAEADTSFYRLKSSAQDRISTQYLRQTSMTVKDISRAVGFSEVANFRRFFIRTHGVSPQEYRKQGQP